MSKPHIAQDFFLLLDAKADHLEIHSKLKLYFFCCIAFVYCLGYRLVCHLNEVSNVNISSAFHVQFGFCFCALVN